jgi:hypothetical protein
MSPDETEVPDKTPFIDRAHIPVAVRIPKKAPVKYIRREITPTEAKAIKHGH